MTSFVVWPNVGYQSLCFAVVFLAPVHGSRAAELVLRHAEVESILGTSLLQEWEAAQALNLAKEALTEATAGAEANSERAHSFHPGKSFSAAVFPSLQDLLGGFTI